MDTKKLAITYFTELKGKKKSINNVEFRTSINELKKEANTGFEEEEVETLIDALVYIKGLACNKFQELLKCIIPHQKVAGKTALKLLEWIFSYNSTVPFGSVVAALDWLIGLVEFGLTDEVSVHAFYLHLYLLIEEKEKAKYACKLIYLLTKPSDVLRWLVRKVQNIENRCGRQNHTTALLGLFKTYKPDCVPEKIPAINLQFAFKNIGRMDSYFCQAQQRLRAEDGENLKRKIVWNSDEGMKKVKAQRTAPIIPPVDYIHFESEKYRTEQLHSLLEFKTTTSLGSNLHKLDMPCNVMSLLQNDAGIYVLIFGDKNLQTRFSYNLYYTLHKVFIEQEAGYSYVEKENFLKRIFALEEYMQQGIPVVSRFLAGYLCIWDTDDFRETILNLLQWVTFSSFSELHDCVLRHIHTMFLSGSIEVKSSVIAMLNKLVQNMVIFGLQRKNKEFTNVFLKNEGDWKDIETLKYVIKFVSKLCELGLSVVQENYLLLNEVLNFFEMMIFLEKFYELSIWTMAPPNVIYSGLITTNALMLSRVCNILLKYENVCLRVKKRKLKNNFTAQVNYQNMYLTDFANCLWKKKCFDSNGSYLFKDVHEHEHLERLSKYIIPNEALSLKKHFALLPYIYLTQTGSDVLQNLEFDSEDMLTITSNLLEEIHNLIQLFIRRDT